MAGLRFAIPFEGVAVTTTAKTVVQVAAPANQRVRICGWRVGCNGTVTTDGPIKVQGLRQTSAGTGGVAATPVKMEASLAESVQSTGLTGPTSGAWTAEPTSSDKQYTSRVHPQGANSETFYFTTEIWVKGGERFGLALTAPQANTVDGELICEE